MKQVPKGRGAGSNPEGRFETTRRAPVGGEVGEGIVAGMLPETSVPHPGWLDEAKAASALRESGKTRIFFRPRVNP